MQIESRLIMTMCEAESLILAVEKYPCLWDIHNKDYHNRDVKDLAWEQVYKEVIKDWETCTQVDKENKGADLKKKWTHIRDYFRRDLQKNQNAPTGSAAKKIKKYIFADLLYFLIPVFDKRSTEGNYQTTDPEDDVQEQDSKTQEEQNVRVYDDINFIEPPSPVSTVPVRSSKRNKKDIPTQILNILHQNQQKANQERQEVEDDDTKFLLSFRTHMKHMNVNQKIDFKLEMLQLVKQTSTEYYSSSPGNYDNFSDNSVTSVSSNEYSSHSPYISAPESSPHLLYKTQSPLVTFGSYLQKNATKYNSAPNNSRVIIKSVTNTSPLQPSVSYVQCDGPRRAKQKNKLHYTPSTSLQNAKPQHAKDTEATTFLVLQSQEQEENFLNIH